MNRRTGGHFACSALYGQEAEGISVTGCFRGAAKRMSSDCLGYLTMLVNKEEQLLPALPPFTVILKRKTALLGSFY